MGFREFLIEQSKEQEKNIKDTLAKLPKKHRDLVDGFKIKWHHDNTLQGDNGHIGLVDPHKKHIVIAAPWNYGREYTFLHEIAHKVFEKWMTKELFKEWKEIVKKTKGKMKQPPEELWCMAYADFFAKNKIVVHHHPEWIEYMKKFIKMTK